MIVREDTYCVLRTEKQSIPGIYKELTLPFQISVQSLNELVCVFIHFVGSVHTV